MRMINGQISFIMPPPFFSRFIPGTIIKYEAMIQKGLAGDEKYEPRARCKRKPVAKKETKE